MPIDEAKAKVSVLALAHRLCPDLRNVGREWEAQCPLPEHDDRNPSFRVNPDKERFFCFGCGERGDVVELARLAWGYELHEVATAAAELLYRFGHPLPERPPSWYRKQQRQKPVRDAIGRARFEHLRRRLFRRFFEPSLLPIEDWEERKEETRLLWEATEPLAEMLIQELDERKRSA